MDNPKAHKRQLDQKLYEDANRQVEEVVADAINALWRLSQDHYGDSYQAVWSSPCGGFAKVSFQPLGEECQGLRISATMGIGTILEDWSAEAAT